MRRRLQIAGVGVALLALVVAFDNYWQDPPATVRSINDEFLEGPPPPIIPSINILIAIPGVHGISAKLTVQKSFLMERRPLSSPPRVLLAPREDLCQRPDPLVEVGPNGSPLLVVFVIWQVSDPIGRQLLRDRWDAIGATQATPRVFLLGKPTSVEMEANITEEQNRWGDLLIFDVNDSYYTLAAKNSGFLQWSRNFCTNSNYVLRLDGTDVVVDFFYLRRALRQKIAAGGDPIQRSILGECYQGSVAVREGRWNMPITTWPFSTYPIYPYGYFSLFTGEAAAILGGERLGLTDDEMMFNDVPVGMLALVAGINGCETFEGVLGEPPDKIEDVIVPPCDSVIAVHGLEPNPQEFNQLTEYFRRCETKYVDDTSRLYFGSD